MGKDASEETNMYKFGPVQQKLLLILAGGIMLGFETSSIRYYRKLRLLWKGWKEIDQRHFNRSVRRLVEQKLLEEKASSDGSFRLVLTKEGQQQAARLDLFGQTIRFKNPKQWDKKWRIIMFDIPEENRSFRDILREHLRELKFYKLQHSVFLSPYPYEKPLAELVDLYGAESFVRIVTVSWIDNDEKLRRYFFPKNRKKAS